MLLPICFCLNAFADARIGEHLENFMDLMNGPELDFHGDIHINAISVANPCVENNENIVTYGDFFIGYHGQTNKFGYALEVGLKTRSGIVKNKQAIVDSANISFLSGSLGTIKVGFCNSAAYLYQITGGSILCGSKGINNADKPLEQILPLSSAAIISSKFRYDDGKSAKLLWISPTYHGFTCAVSYTPSAKYANPFKKWHHKSYTFNAKRAFSRNTGYQKNFTTAAIVYSHGSAKEFHVKYNLSTWIGSLQSKVAKFHHIRAFNIGAQFGYGNFDIALGYTDGGKSCLATNFSNGDDIEFMNDKRYDIFDKNVGIYHGANAGKTYSAGISYNAGATQFSCGYLHSQTKMSYKDKVKADVINIAVQYNINKALSTYFEYDNIKMTMCDRARIYDAANGHKMPDWKSSDVFILGIMVKI